jgi:CRP/FNR family transcriptional regulator, cyclic AMP receptor protein
MLSWLVMESSATLTDFLSRAPMFGGLETRTRSRITEMLRAAAYPENTVVVREGEAGLCMYIVREGEVALYQQGGDVLVRIARLGVGDCFGEMAIIDIQPRSATVITECPCVLYSLTNRDLYTLYHEDMPGYVMVIQNLCRELSRRLRRADARITESAAAARDVTTQIGVSQRVAIR